MKLEQLNPTVKVLTVLICVMLLSFQYLVTLNLSVFAVCIVLLRAFSHADGKQLIRFLIPAFITALGLFITGLYHAKHSSVSVPMENIQVIPYAVRAALSTNLYSALQLSTRLLAYAGLGIFFTLSTDGEFFIQSLMHQCHLSPKFAYSILAAVHLLPNMMREYKSVKLAFATRGIRVGRWNLHVIFTMLVNCVRWSEAVTMAMESKGFHGEGNRTYYSIPNVHITDLIFCVTSIALIILGMCCLSY